MTYAEINQTTFYLIYHIIDIVMWINHLDIDRINVFYYQKLVNNKNVM